MQEVVDTLQALDRQQSCKAIIITGTGKAFCAGVDLKEMSNFGYAEVWQDTKYY
jgi:enoyl-CoA hydratase/carnithine racemase